MAGKTNTLFARLVALAGAVFWSPAGVVAADIDRIEAQEAKALVEKGQAVVVDVRSRAAWDTGHVAGAFHVPMDELAARMAQLPKDKLVITYCTCPAEASAVGAAQKMQAAGFTRLAALKGGLSAWQQVGGKVSTEAPAQAH
jgi:rhodanese-related sulfurtransferase